MRLSNRKPGCLFKTTERTLTQVLKFKSKFAKNIKLFRVWTSSVGLQPPNGNGRIKRTKHRQNVSGTVHQRPRRSAAFPRSPKITIRVRARETPKNLAADLDSIRINETLLRRQSEENMKRWSSGKTPDGSKVPIVRVLNADWGDCALKFSKKYGTTFAVLNMANAEFLAVTTRKATRRRKKICFGAPIAISAITSWAIAMSRV